MRTTHHVPALVLALASLLAVTAACRKDATGSTGAARPISGAYDGTVSGASRFIVSSGQVVAVRTLRKDLAAAGDPLQARFAQGLHPRLKEYCSPCHAGQNAFPFASPGLDLAYATVKKYVTADPEASQIMRNIRASHNRVDPAWAAVVGPLLQELAP